VAGPTQGWGISSTGGGTTGLGAVLTGGSTGCGAYAQADEGVSLSATHCGLAARGSTTSNGTGVIGQGGGTGAGVLGIAESATADSNTKYAVQVGHSGANGHLLLGGGNPANTTAFANSITPTSAIKAWGHVVSNGTTTPTTHKAFNVTSAVCGGAGDNSFIVTMASAMTGTDHYAVIIGQHTATSLAVSNTSSTVFTVTATGADCDASSGFRLDFVVLGFQ
jgi:hypothetical protein